MISTRCRFNRRRRGTTLVLLVLLLTVFVAMVAFAVDVSRMYLVRSQLQSAVDAGTLAAALTLKEDGNIDSAVASAREYVQLNRVGWLRTVPEDAIAVTPGVWDDTTGTFTATNEEPDSVRVFARLDDEPLFFAGVLGLNKFAVPRDAVATLGGGKLDVMLVLDLSGSMRSQGRIEALQDAAPAFVDVIQSNNGDDQIGVMGYGAILGSYDPASRGHTGIPYTSAPASLYPSESEEWVAVMESSLTTGFDSLSSNVLNNETLIANKYNSYTPIGAAIRDAAHYLDVSARQDVARAIVLMSDGHANRPRSNARGYARDMANYAKSLNVKVYTISLGNSADDQLMEDIATATDAKFFKASGSGQTILTENLRDAFRKVAASVKGTQIVQ